MKLEQSIEKYMTVVPKTIGYDQTLAQAQDFMRKLKLRHLPVLKEGKLIGILSDRDIKYLLQFKDINPNEVTVEEAATQEPYAVAPVTPLKDVVGHMAEKKYGCAIVIDQKKLVGIFTEIDAYKALSNLLSTEENF